MRFLVAVEEHPHFTDPPNRAVAKALHTSGHLRALGSRIFLFPLANSTSPWYSVPKLSLRWELGVRSNRNQLGVCDAASDAGLRFTAREVDYSFYVHRVHGIPSCASFLSTPAAFASATHSGTTGLPFDLGPSPVGLPSNCPFRTAMPTSCS
jgi:hypothetical protein